MLTAETDFASRLSFPRKDEKDPFSIGYCDCGERSPIGGSRRPSSPDRPEPISRDKIGQRGCASAKRGFQCARQIGYTGLAR